MSWSRPPFQCKLNGIPITVERSRDVVGRALVVHAYPDRDQADLEDAGGEPFEVTLDGYVTGVAWYARLILLQAEIRKTTTQHELVHPQHGTLYGRVRRLEIRHQDDEHDTARVSLEFVEGLLQGWSFSVGVSVASAAAAVEAAAAAVTSAAAAL